LRIITAIKRIRDYFRVDGAESAHWRGFPQRVAPKNDQQPVTHAEVGLAIWENVLGPEHPLTARSLKNLAHCCSSAGDLPRARELAAASLAATRKRSLGLASISSENDALAYAAAGRHALETYLSVFRGGVPPGTIEDPYAALLLWKGHVARSLGKSREQIFRLLTSEQRRLLEDLRSVQMALSNLISLREIKDRAEHERNLERLRKEKRDLEASLRKTGGEFEEERPLATAEISKSLPSGFALVDFLVHRIWEATEHTDGKLVRPARWSDPRLSAWVVRPGEPHARWLELGAAAPIEEATKAFLEDLTARRGVGGVTAGTKSTGPTPNDRLRELLWAPLEKHLSGAERLFVCPDGFLGTLPFEVLQAEDGSFLIEKHAFVYLQDAVSLVESRTRGGSSGEGTPSLLVAGAVDYEDREVAPEGLITLADRRGHFESTWLPLSETRRETDGIAHLFGKSFEKGKRLLLQDGAPTEERLKAEIPGNSIVHLATHGYFQPEALPSMWERLREGSEEPLAFSHEERLVTGYLPGLLSGLVCAGANRREHGRDNGLLTAEEVGWLDLSGCDLVVLSACETALGTPRAGEGMISLRRSFHLAGARTVISSLWKVRDESTKDLMLGFYTRLWQKGRGPLEALRGAQLEMLARNRAKYEGNGLPSMWGAFLLSGEWR
jgi:CHAT domain-containing protein